MFACKFIPKLKPLRKARDPLPHDASPSGRTAAALSCRIRSTRELRKIFSRFDANGDGKISADELEAVLRSTGEVIGDPSAKAAAIMSAVDADGDGCIRYEEFAELMEGEVDEDMCLEEMRRAFRVYDRNGDGKITARELQHVLRGTIGERATMSECRRMIRAVDRDGDGAVSFEEFLGMMAPGSA